MADHGLHYRYHPLRLLTTVKPPALRGRYDLTTPFCCLVTISSLTI